MKNEEYEALRERISLMQRSLADLGTRLGRFLRSLPRRLEICGWNYNGWHMNGSGAHAPYQTMCLIITKQEKEYAAELYSFNSRYHEKHPVEDRWRRPEPNLSKKERWIDDKDVVVWKVI